MFKVENRESAHVKSRVKDLSVVPNVVGYVPLLTAITPLSNVEKFTNESGDEVYKPVLIRDRDSLIATFGDPRIDPQKYIDLYTIMHIVDNGTSCYVEKVDSGTTGTYSLDLRSDISNTPAEDVDTDTEGTITLNIENPVSVGRVEYEFLDEVWVEIPKDKYNVTYSSDSININVTDELVKSKIWTGSDDTTAKPVRVYLFSYEEVDKEIGTNTISIDEEGTPKNETILVQSTATPDKVKVKEIFMTETIDENSVTSKLDLNKLNIQYNIIPENDGSSKYQFVIHLGKEYTATQFIVNKLTDDVITEELPITKYLVGYSSLTEDITIKQYIKQLKPYSLGLKYLFIDVYKDNSESNKLCSAKVEIKGNVTNKNIVSSINSVTRTYVTFELAKDVNPDAYWDGTETESTNNKQSIMYSLSKVLLNDNHYIDLPSVITEESPNFEVTLEKYKQAIDVFKDRQYHGCLMADMTSPVTTHSDNETSDEGNPSKEELLSGVLMLTPLERRSLHWYLKQVAAERKDVNVLLSTPLKYGDSYMDIETACNWTLSLGDFAEEYFEYGMTNTLAYEEQSFYLEMYYSWLEMSCVQFENGIGKSVTVKVAPSGVVANNILVSYRDRGPQYPVAGDQLGTLPDIYKVINNPKTKLDRDTLVASRINPIYNTGTRGVQIYGNETLNAGYTDLNAAHIARTLVSLRSRIDEYTETLKFSINNMVLWDTWKNYVSSYILEPLKSENALASYTIEMGTDTTSREEIANRTIRGNISLVFYQSAEIFDLSFIVYSSSTAFEE